MIQGLFGIAYTLYLYKLLKNKYLQMVFGYAYFDRKCKITLLKKKTQTYL